ncbi:MAG: hypothetical protein M3299_10040 [Thermoproteota archaeon]|nr:hypothetical protein [Thermoproteota archaeon]
MIPKSIKKERHRRPSSCFERVQSKIYGDSLAFNATTTTNMLSLTLKLLDTLFDKSSVQAQLLLC